VYGGRAAENVSVPRAAARPPSGAARPLPRQCRMISYELVQCAVCGAADSVVVADADAIRTEVEALWEHHTRDDDAADTPLLDRVAFTQRPPLRVEQCTRCGLLFRNPRERHVREIYEEDRVDTATLAALASSQAGAFDAQLARLGRMRRTAGSLLEVGPYVGAFMDAARRAGWRTEAVDVNAAVVAFLRERGHAAAQGGIEDARAASYDVVAIWNCFEQLPDPGAAARAAHARLRTGGVLALRVPNGAFYAALRPRLERAPQRVVRALLARHNWLGFPYRHGFTPASLRLLLEREGFDVVSLRGAGALPVPGRRDGVLTSLADRVLKPWLEAWAKKR